MSPLRVRFIPLVRQLGVFRVYVPGLVSFYVVGRRVADSGEVSWYLSLMPYVTAAAEGRRPYATLGRAKEAAKRRMTLAAAKRALGVPRSELEMGLLRG